LNTFKTTEATMKIIIPGGSGHLGTILTRSLRASGHDVIALTRDVRRKGVLWDGRTLGPWAGLLDGADAVINLAGRSVDCRYGRKHREEILRSRVDSTTVIGQAIAAAERPPKVWLQASTATIYAHRYDLPNDEHRGIIGGEELDVPETWRFSSGVARAWERAIDDASTPRTRKVKLRTAIVMHAAAGGPFEIMRRHIRLGLGHFGDGRQWMSWIHERDFTRAVQWLLDHDLVAGPVNLTAPNPLTNADFTSILREECGTSLSIPVPRWMTEVGTWLLRTESELVLKSRRVIPARLLEQGFRFEYPEWRDAAQELCARFREHRSAYGAQSSPQW
jgi:uncharacterized protein (TIGR01777 family)